MGARGRGAPPGRNAEVRVLLTGAGGQLGRDLAVALRDEEQHVFGHRALDIADRAAVTERVARVAPDWVINAAAYNDVDGAESDEERAFAVNGRGPGYLAESAARVGARILHISTDYVFDGRKGASYTEDDAPNPINVYGRSKYEGEQRVLAVGARACVIRTAWLYGHQGKNFVKAMLAAVDRPEPLRVVADQVGSPTFTEDLAQAIVALLRTPASGLFHVTNVGACTRLELARAIVQGRRALQPITSAEAGRPAPRPANSALASRRWEAAGLAPLRPWQAALRSFLDSVVLVRSTT